MSLAKPLIFLLAAACLIWVGRCSSPTPGQPSRDSTDLAHAARQIDTVVKVVSGALGRVDTVIRWKEARRPPIVPPRGADGEIDSLRARVAYDSATILVLGQALVEVRDTLAQVRDRLQPIPAQIDHGANIIGRLERQRPTPWSAGVLLEGATPVGGYLSRDVWRVRVGVEATDGASEPATVRVSVGLRF